MPQTTLAAHWLGGCGTTQRNGAMMTSKPQMTELTALPGLRVPLTDFRRDQQVRVCHDNEPALFKSLMIPANGTEPWAILQTFTGTSIRAVRISDVAQYDGRLG